LLIYPAAPNLRCFNGFTRAIPLVLQLHLSRYLPFRKAEPGATLTTLFGNTEVQSTTPVVPQKRGWMPLLTVLFLISYGLMTMLIVEQGSTIESQRALIRDLLRDSTELWTAKGKAVTEKNRTNAQRRGQAPSATAQAPLTHDPEVQTPSTQSPSSKAPSSQATMQNRSQSHPGKGQKPQLRPPSRPASDLADDRRALITI
jgi:hypothetical protein